MDPTFVFKDNDFLSDNWKEHLVCGGESGRMLVDRVVSYGEGSFRQHIHQWGNSGDEDETECVVRHSNTTAIYSPSDCGSIISIDFDCTLQNIERSTATRFALLIEQNNMCFMSKNSLPAKQDKWTTYSMNDLRSSDFIRLDDTDKDVYEIEHPNFSFLGGDIRFGYVTTSSTSQPEDEAVSGIAKWRVTVYHENAEAGQHNTRVMQLEHNNNVLLQELSDMHEHADITRREHAAQLANLHSIQDDLAMERTVSGQLRRELSAQRQALEAAEAETRAAHAETEQLQELVASSGTELEELHNALTQERSRCSTLIQCINNKDEALAKTKKYEEELARLKAENGDGKEVKILKQKVKDMSDEIDMLREQLEEMEEKKKSLQLAFYDTKSSEEKLEDMLSFEKSRRAEAEHTLASSNAALKDELRALCSRMEADILHERDLRIQLEREHREQLSRVEASARAEKASAEEQSRIERLSYMEREAKLLEEKRNLATSLQAATTKSSLTEQRLSNQLLSVSALHKSEVERIAVLEEELKHERETREMLESQLPKDDEDWEVVDEQ